MRHSSILRRVTRRAWASLVGMASRRLVAISVTPRVLADAMAETLRLRLLGADVTTEPVADADVLVITRDAPVTVDAGMRVVLPADGSWRNVTVDRGGALTRGAGLLDLDSLIALLNGE